MLRIARDGADVVYARRIGRDEPWHKRLLATALLPADGAARARALPGAGGRLPADVAAGGRHRCATMPERRRFLRGMVAWVGFEQVPIEYRRAGRSRGRGASYPALFRLAAEAMASFSDVPLALASLVGMVDGGAGAAWPRSCCSCCDDLRLGDRVVGVWTLIALLFLGGVQLISVGILGPLPGARARADAAPAAVPRRPRRARRALRASPVPGGGGSAGRAARARRRPARGQPGALRPRRSPAPGGIGRAR